MKLGTNDDDGGEDDGGERCLEKHVADPSQSLIVIF